ncbi:MAG: hypothetical protein HY657_19980 [Acidobacteria bacterium]|nr:hypothetical protein [Acidobacteriota bacterium]
MPTSFHVSRIDGLRALVLVLIVVGCTTATARVPARRMTNVVISPLQRILVAGFVTDAESPLDVNTETVRLLREELRRQGILGVMRADPVTPTSEAAFSDREYWRVLGEEHGAPLIVSGVVRLRRAPPNVFQRGGRAGVYQIQPGFFLETEIVLIDGATGQVLSSERLPRKAQYGSGRRGSPSLMYYSMMYSLMPEMARAVLAERKTAVSVRRTAS